MKMMLHLVLRPALILHLDLRDRNILSVSVSVCVGRVPSVSVIRITAGTRLAVAVARVSPVWPVAAVTAVNVALYSKEGHSIFKEEQFPVLTVLII